MDLYARRHWIFDLDGTLTVAVHDFEAIRAELGLPRGQPILEAIARLPAAEAQRAHERLDAIELELARRARAAEGASELLASLVACGKRLGILTRNSRRNAHETLRAADLARHFDPATVLGREDAPHKPAPDAIRRLLERWGAAAHDAVMVGDYLFDLVAGRAAGAATVYVDASGVFRFADHADLRVRSLRELLQRP